MLVHAELDWTGPARFDEWIDIAVAPTRIGTTSFDLRYDAMIDERPTCTTTITYVAIISGTNTKTNIPDRVRMSLSARLVR
jgi:acyl-CoA thioesterase FadM